MGLLVENDGGHDGRYQLKDLLDKVEMEELESLHDVVSLEMSRDGVFPLALLTRGWEKMPGMKK